MGHYWRIIRPTVDVADSVLETIVNAFLQISLIESQLHIVVVVPDSVLPIVALRTHIPIKGIAYDIATARLCFVDHLSHYHSDLSLKRVRKVNDERIRSGLRFKLDSLTCRV